MLKKLLKSALTLILTALATWTASIALWRTLGHRPSTAELVIGLVGVPAMLLAAISWWRRRPAEEPEPPASPSQPIAHAFDTRRWAILASDVMTPIGHTPGDVIQALQAHQRPDLDATLKDPDGFPLYAARVTDVDTDMPLASTSLNLATLDTCTQDCLRTAAMMLDICRNLAIAAANSLAVNAPLQPVLHLHALLPGRWPQEQRQAVLNAMRSTVSPYWQADIEAFSHAVGENVPPGPLDRIDLPALEDPTGRLRLAMVVGGDSYISTDAIASLAYAGQWMTPANPGGKVPGEAAAGILISTPPHADLFAQGPGVVMTAAVGAGAAGRPGVEPAADAPPADRAESLPTLLDRLLAMTGEHVDAIKAMVSDEDPRSPSGPAILALAAQRLPHLDPAQDHLAAAAGCGDVGAAAFPLALALGAQACSDRGAGVLYVSTPMAQTRMALMIEPMPPVETASSDAPAGTAGSA